MAVRLRTVLIHSNPQLGRKLASSLARSGYDVFPASGRGDGLPLIYETRPDLILLEAAEPTHDCRETVSRIRLLTDIPIILLAKRSLDRSDPLVADGDLVLPPPHSAAKVASAIRASLKSSVPPVPCASTCPEETVTPVATGGGEILRNLAWLQVLLSGIKNAEAPEQFLLKLILEHLLTVLGTDWVGLYLAERTAESQPPILKCSHSVGVGEWTNGQAHFLDGLIADAAKNQHLVVWDKPISGPAKFDGESTNDGYRIAVVPLIARNRVHGALSIANRGSTSRRLTKDQLQFITTAGEVFAFALEHGWLLRLGHEPAILDADTGLYSQAYAERTIHMERARSQRYGSNFSVVQLDWANGREYAETHSRTDYAGMLRHIASLCLQYARSSDLVARYAESSIALVLSETDALQAQHVAERMGQTVRASFAEAAQDARPEIVARVVPDKDIDPQPPVTHETPNGSEK